MLVVGFSDLLFAEFDMKQYVDIRISSEYELRP